jgi:hypothetical protein
MGGIGLCHHVDFFFDLSYTPSGKLFAFVSRTDMATVPWTVSCDPHKKTRGLIGRSNNTLFKHFCSPDLYNGLSRTPVFFRDTYTTIRAYVDVDVNRLKDQLIHIFFFIRDNRTLGTPLNTITTLETGIYNFVRHLDLRFT